MSTRLNKVLTGKIQRPALVCIYGQESVGKSTFGADAPSPIFFDVENGSANLNVSRMPDLNTFADVLSGLDELINEKHNYKSLVIDSIDCLERKLHGELCRSKGVDVIQNVAGGYGKGETLAMNSWEPFLNKITRVREKGINVVLICHAEVKTFNDPDAIAPYDRFQLKLEKRSAAVIKEFVDDLLFARFETLVTKDKNEKKGRATGDGKRIMYTEHRPAFDAKNRHSLPFEMEVSWGTYYGSVTGGQNSDTIMSEIKNLMGTLPSDIQKKIIESIELAGEDQQKLLKIKNKVNVTLKQKES